MTPPSLSTRRSIRLVLALTSALALLIAPASAAERAAESRAKEQELIRILQSAAPAAEKAIPCKQLAIYGTPTAVPALAPLLADPDLSSWARIALEAIPGPAADAALRDALARVEGRLLVGVINSIGVRSDAQATDGLVAKLKNPDAEVASAAAIALGRIGSAAAAQALLPALSTTRGDVGSAVAEGLILCAERSLAGGNNAEAVKLYDAVRKANVIRPRIIEATRGAILARQSDGLPLLLEQLHSTETEFFRIGLRVARELPGRPVTDALVAELGRSSAERQPLVLLALADRSDDAVMPAVLKAAGSGSTDLRLAAIRVLEHDGDAASVPVLLEAAVDNDARLASAAKVALLKLEGPAVDADLLARLPQATGKTLQTLLELAAQRRLPAALPAVLRSIESPDPATRRAAIEGVGALGNEAQAADLVKLLAKTSDAPARGDLQKALTALCARAGTRCVPALLPLARHTDSELRMAGLHLLASVGGPEALAAVTRAINDADEAVQDDAVGLLATWPNNWPDDVGAAEPLLNLAKSGKKLAHQLQGVRGYLQYIQENKRLSDAEKVGQVKELLTLIQRPEEKRLAIAALGTLPTASSLDLLGTLANDRAVAEEAYLAIVAVAPSKRLTDVSPEMRRKALQLVLDRSQNNPTRKKAEGALNALK
ncbi:MAG: HEAT repeat domain-containing protein [Verrucomicrobiales bacterium]|nr:HEAT repeat domain-containing protein [Verrucomicrobiales bacterium]